MNDDFKPAWPGSCRLSVSPYPVTIPGDQKLSARYILTNTSDEQLRGCASGQRAWTFVGSDKTMTLERSPIHRVCFLDQQFLIGKGESFSWHDSTNVPDVGLGKTEVVFGVDIVLYDPIGEAPWEHLFTARTSFEVVIEKSWEASGKTPNKRIHLTDPACHGPGKGASIGVSRSDPTPGHVAPTNALFSGRILEPKAGDVDGCLARAAPALPAGDAQRKDRE